MKDVLFASDPRLYQPVCELNQAALESDYVQEVARNVLQIAAYGTPMRRSSVGLAAIQLGEPINLVAIDLQADRLRSGRKVSPEYILLANLAVAASTEENVRHVEGCHSLGALAGVVERPRRVRATGFNLLDGTIFDEEVEGYKGFLAAVFQHEDGHNHNQTFVDITPDSRLYWAPTKESYRRLLDDEGACRPAEFELVRRYRSYASKLDGGLETEVS